jgi:hypothetical protein
MKVTVVSMWAKNYSEIADITIPNLLAYCERHGYDFRSILLEDGNAYHFRKHEFFKELFETDVELIWYMDVDCLVTNHNIEIESFVDECDFFITKDVHELNGGSVIIKNNEHGRRFNDFVLSKKDKYDNEQNVYNEFGINWQMDGILGRLGHPSINSYDYRLYPEYPNIRERDKGHWHEGDFVLHVPGAPMNVRIERLKNAKIIK